MSFELKIERVLKAPRASVWRCWAEVELLKRWYCPLPWRVARAEMDPRPGGRANVFMEGPNGEKIDCPGCMLEVVPMERLTFTDAFTEGFVPSPKPFMTGFVRLADAPGGGTDFTWGARHWTAEDKAQHEAMGFAEGWGKAADQLAALALEVAGR